MLVELSVYQTSLGGETTLEIPVFVIDHLQEGGVVAADSLLRQLNDFLCL